MSTACNQSQEAVLQTMENQLSRFIDQHGLVTVVLAAANVCYLKGMRLQENWRDVKTGKLWEQAAACLEKAAQRIELP
jgi:hypothetical protein